MKEDIEGFHCHDGGKKGNLRDSTYRGHDFETYILHPSVSLPCAALRFFGKGAVPEASAGVVTDRAVQGDLIQRKTKKDRMYKYSKHSTDLKAAEAAFSEMCLGLTIAFGLQTGATRNLLGTYFLECIRLYLGTVRFKRPKSRTDSSLRYLSNVNTLSRDLFQRICHRPTGDVRTEERGRLSHDNNSGTHRESKEARRF